MAHRVPIAIAQLQPQKGDYPANLARLRTLFRQLDQVTPRPRVLHLPETALTGYFLEGGVREVALTAGALARDLDTQYRADGSRPPLDVVVGFYEVWRNTLHNSAMYVRLGEDEGPCVLHVHRKNFLPTYGLFDEERFVERGLEVRAFDAPWGRTALLVCEDAWHSIAGTLAAIDGAQVVFVCSAAPVRGTWPRDDAIPGPYSVARWDRLIRDIAEEHGVFVTLANLVGSEGGKMFGGASLVVGPRGDVRARAPLWDEALLTTTLDLRDVTRARADMPLLSDLRIQLPHLLPLLGGAGTRAEAAPQFDPARDDADSTAIPLVRPEPGAAATCALPLVDAGDAGLGEPAPITIDAPLVERWLMEFIRDEMRQRNFTKAIVGVSGGVDSAVTAYLAARALGPENVIGVRMPYRTSSAESLA
ncbi:MAG TPA: nitrilase-related carbon-nitrogen hydrolase, partial [Gemmatimonadaceae bacterium]|nr:nitrilase-related carbon-nitrogen hydrolase [Gemmatimonadaceae bacterium]